ncbi:MULTISPECIES: hypothetical protein [unclassified Hoeflea]|jgi:hypothetical protein|uniref:hypothetical protein n=1 Tax=unclassified Hoeflea TaxID=2614931 RepID=UPI002AFF5E2E|nr:hypothetical protein [Hoeflea sp.]
MVFGMTPFTLFHVLLSLIGIASGLVVLYGWLQSQRMPGWTAIFLFTTIATTLTGFLFPFKGFTPAIDVGIISTVILIVALVALYHYHLAGHWRTIFIISAMAALYFNCFVLVVQAFVKIPALHSLAPNGSEPPFAVTQAVVLIGFLAAGYMAVRRYHPVTA